MSQEADPRPVHVVVPADPARLGPPWWRTTGTLRSMSLLMVVTLAVLLVNQRTDWSRTSLGVSGLSLDCVGIVFVALPFVSRSWIRVRRDRLIRSAEAEVAAFERDLERLEEAQESIERQLREGVPRPRAEFPDIDDRNLDAEALYEMRATWRRRLVVPEEEAASFIVLGTTFMVIGFAFQAASYFVR